MADNFSALRTSRGEPSLFEQVRTTAQLTPEAQYEMTSGASDTQFEKGLRSGAAGLTAGSFANEALSQEVGGDADWQRSRDLALQTQAQGQMYAPRVSSLRDIGSLEDAGDYAAGAIGQGAMSMAPTLATTLLTRGRGKFGAATSYAGGATTAYGLERGEAALNQYADPTLAATSAEDRDLAATTKGVINAGLEAIVPAGLAGSVLRKPAGSFLGHVGRASLAEGLTETAQQGVGFGAEKHLDPNRQLDPWDVADAFAAGALTGGGVSAATRGPAHGAQALSDRFARGQQGDAAPIDLNPPSAPMEGAPPGTPLLPGPEDGGDAGGLFDTLNERFGPGVREQAQRTKDYVSDTIDRMNEAAKTAQSPSDFLRQVFGNSVEDAAAADLRPDTEDPGVLNAADPAAAMQQRDAQRQERAASFAAELLSDPATPDAIKERVASFGGDFTNPEAQAFVARNLVSQRAGEKLTTAVADLIDLSKDFGSKAAEAGTDLATKARDMLDKGMTAAADRIVKKNLQDATPAEQAAFNKLIFDNLTDEAKANPTVRQRLPEIANAMLAFAARTGDLTKADLKTLSRMQDGLALFKDPDALATQLTEYAGLPRTEDSFLSRIKRVTNAQQDIRQPNSFLYSSLTEEAKDSLRPAQLNQLARLVDDFTLSDASKAQGDKVLAGLTAAFGSKESAQAVLDYYQQQNRADVRFDPNEMLTEGGITERDGAPAPSYQFADAKAMRPFRAFAGQMSSEGGMRRRLRESTIAGAALRRSSPGGARVRPIKMSQYVADTGGNPEAEVKRIASDLKDRIEQHKARKDEDRTKQINELQGELTLLRQAYKDGGAQAALDLYEVLQVSGQEQNDTIATDADIAKMATLADAKDAKETRVTFQREDGSKFTLSAESMWKTLGDKEGSGKGENAQARAKRLFADAAASVLARPEVAKMVTPMEKILIDRKLDVRAKKKGNPEYRAMVADALKAAEGSIKSLQTTLDNVVDEYLEAADNEAKSEEYGSRREEIEAIIDQNITQLSERLDAAREGKGPMAGNMPAQAVARQKLRMYRDAQGQIDAIRFDEEFDERDNNRSGVPGADESGPMGPNGLPRTRMNEELGNTGTRYSEEDTGLGVGVEKRGPKSEASAEKKEAKAEAKKAEPKPKTMSDAAVAALYDIAVKENYGRLDTPEKVLRYAAMARALMDQLGQIPEDARTDQQQELLSKLDDMFDQGKGFAFDWESLWDGLDPTDAQKAQLEGLIRPKAEPGTARQSGSDRVVKNNRQMGESFLTKLRSGGLHGDFNEDIALFLDPEEFDFKGIKANYVMFGVAGGAKNVYVLPTGAMHAMQGVDKMSVEEFDQALEELALYSATVYGDGEVFVGVPRYDGAGARALLARGVAEVSEQKWVNTGEPILKIVGGVGVRTNRDLFERAAGFAKFVDGTSDVFWSRETSGAASAGRVRTKNIGGSPKGAAETLRQSAMKPKRGRPGKIDQQAIIDEIRRIRGDKVKVIFQKFSEVGGSGEFSMNKDKTDRLIKIAVNASNPMGAAWHESLHDFFAMLNEDRAGRSIKKDLIDAAEAPQVKKRLRELLAKHPEALKQIEESAEERVAYMYQFWAEGLLHLGPTGTGIFARIRQLFRDLFGVVGTDQRAEDLLTALHSGKFADPSVVAEVLADMPGDRFTNKMEKAAPELTAALNKVFSAAPDRLRGYQNDALNTLADMFSSERGKLGFIQNRFQQQGVWENKLASILDGTTAQERRAALENLQAMKEPSSALEKQLARFFGELHGYMVEAGVKTLDSKTKKWVPLREVKNYFPRMFDRQALMADREGFISLLQKHGGMDLKQANAAFEALTRGTGQLDLAENEHALGFTPYAQAVQDRRFTFINPSNAPEFAKYQVKDLADTTTSYVKQAVHRAEYARMFGNSGEVITKLISESGIKDSKELEDISKVVRGLEGTLGSDMSVATKELMSGVMTLQNLVVLPLALFSQMVDPIVLAARSGDLKDAGNAFATAIKRLAGNKVDGEELASMLGIISQDSVLEAMGVAYGTAHMSGRMRSINRVFFKYNGMQGWNSSMRIAATVAGERYLLANKNNEKVLAEFGLVPSDIKTVLSAEFQKADARGNRPLRERLEVDNPKVQQALFRFVDEAVLRPSASNRPVWVSDPRFLLVAHLKQFTFAMQTVVLKRANRELAEGNPKPWGVLMLAMPVILAADMAKFALAGNVPTGWGFKDYLVHAVERSGLLGLGDFHVQATYGVDRGKMPGEGLLGPTFEHLIEILRWLGGDPRTSVEDVIDRTVPGARFI